MIVHEVGNAVDAVLVDMVRKESEVRQLEVHPASADMATAVLWAVETVARTELEFDLPVLVAEKGMDPMPVIAVADRYAAAEVVVGDIVVAMAAAGIGSVALVEDMHTG